MIQIQSNCCISCDSKRNAIEADNKFLADQEKIDPVETTETQAN